MVRMRGVDLSIFQFDYDLTWAGLFMEADGTILGRYGAGSRDSMHYNSVAGLRNAMARALKLHHDRSENKAGLAAKKSDQIKFMRPRDLPYPEIKRIVESDTAVKNCVHCHMVQSGLNQAIIDEPNYHPDKIRSLFPTPEKFGVMFDADHGLKVARVLPQTGAQKAKIQVGDVLTHVEGQPLISIADFIWALRGVKDPGTANLQLKRDGEAMSLKVPLPKGWKLSNISWRVSTNDLPPKLELWLVPTDKRQRKAVAVSPGSLALRVRGVFGHAVKKAGLKKGDVVVGVGDWHEDASPEEFVQHIRLKYFRPGSIVPITVIRGQRKLELEIRF